jgi:hypothetical protein
MFLLLDEVKPSTMAAPVPLTRTDSVRHQVIPGQFAQEVEYLERFPGREVFTANAHGIDRDLEDTDVACTRLWEYRFVFAVDPAYLGHVIGEFGIDRSSVSWCPRDHMDACSYRRVLECSEVPTKNGDGSREQVIYHHFKRTGEMYSDDEADAN